MAAEQGGNVPDKFPDQRFDDEAIVLIDELLDATGIFLGDKEGRLVPAVTLIADALHRAARFEMMAAHAMLEKRSKELYAAGRQSESDVVAGLAAQIFQRIGNWRDPKSPF